MSKQKKDRKQLEKKAMLALKYKLKVEESSSYLFRKIDKLNNKLLNYIRKHFSKMDDADDEIILVALEDVRIIFQDLCQNTLLLIDVSATNRSSVEQSESEMKVLCGLISSIVSSLKRQDYAFYYDTLISRLLEGESFEKAIAKFIQHNAINEISKEKN